MVGAPADQASDTNLAEPQSVRTSVATELVPDGVATVAPAKSQSPTIDKDGAKPKAIFLFADGTGNSSAKLFKTNVWRLYEALDLGRAPEHERVQIAYYDNGVGTSNFRPLRLLGGIFGIGLKANVLRLYSFLCQNYSKGDKIYAFGFSRGAFTVRLLVGLIAAQGIIVRKDGAWEMAFCPQLDGQLHLMLNDTGLTYANNSGSATVEVIDLGPRDVDAACAPWREPPPP